MADLFDRRLLFVMGKGGVGKSFVSAALVRIALGRGKRVLMVQINTPDKIAGYLDCEKATEEIREVFPDLFSVSISPQAALKEYVIMQVRLEIIYRLVFENRAVNYFLRAVPALNDLVVLGKIYYHVMQTEKKSDKPLYDIVIVDAPPTGQGLFLLRLPTVMLNAVGAGPINREAKAMLAMLRDPEITAINLVTLPEEMPVAETEEMYKTIVDDYNMPLGALFANAIFPKAFLPGDEKRVEALEGLAGGREGLGGLIRAAKTIISRRSMCEKYLGELAARVPLRQVRIPYVFSEGIGPVRMEKIAELIEDQIGGLYGS